MLESLVASAHAIANKGLTGSGRGAGVLEHGRSAQIVDVKGSDAREEMWHGAEARGGARRTEAADAGVIVYGDDGPPSWLAPDDGDEQDESTPGGDVACADGGTQT